MHSPKLQFKWKMWKTDHELYLGYPFWCKLVSIWRIVLGECFGKAQSCRKPEKTSTEKAMLNSLVHDIPDFGWLCRSSSAGKCQVDAKLSAEAEARNAAQMQAWPIRKKWKHGNICGEIGYKSLVGSIFIPHLWQRYQVATGVEVELRNRFPSPIQALLQKKNKMLEEALQLALKAQEKVPHPRVFGGLPGVKP